MNAAGDAGSGDPNNANNGDLRYVIGRLNAMGAADNTIGFAAGIGAQITLGAALPAIQKNVTINGPGADTLTVERAANAGAEFRIFEISANTNVEVNNLTLSNGKVLDVNGRGGAVLNSGTLTLRNVKLRGNSAHAGGAVYSNGAALRVLDSEVRNNNSETAGGGIWFGSSANGATIQGGQILDNTAEFSGGGIYIDRGTVTVEMGTMISGNKAMSGAGIRKASGTLTLNSVVIRANLFHANNIGSGGGISNVEGNITIIDTEVSNHLPPQGSTSNGGGIYSTFGNIDISGTSRITGNTATNGGGIYLSGPTTCTITDGQVANNTATQRGGGAYLFGSTLTFRNVQGTGNTSGQGPAVYVTGGGTHSLRSGSNISMNSGGAAIYLASGSVDISEGSTIVSNDGGGVEVAGGDATLEDVTITGNSVQDILVSAGTVTETATGIADIVKQTGGTVTIASDPSASLTVNTSYELDDGTLTTELDGTLAVGGGGTAFTQTGGYHYDYGTLDVSGDYLQQGGSAWWEGDATVTGDYLHLDGSVDWSNGPITVGGDFQQEGGVANLMTGTIQEVLVDYGGTLNVNTFFTGSILVTEGAFASIGGTIVGTLTNAGSIALDGSLSIQGNFYQTSTGALAFDTSGWAMDHLSVSGYIGCDGVLSVRGVTDGYYDLIDWGSYGGTFAVDPPSVSMGWWEWSYSSSHFSLWWTYG